MKLMFHISGNEGGGVATWLTLLAEQMCKRGHEVMFLANTEGKYLPIARDFGQIRCLNIPIVNMGAWYLGPMRLPNLAMALRNIRSISKGKNILREILQQKSPEAIIGNGPASASLLGKAAMELNIPLISVIHGVGCYDNDFLSIRSRISARYLNRCRSVVGVSQTALKRYDGLLRVRKKIIYNAPRSIVPAAESSVLRQRWSIPADALVIGSMGRMVRVKGYHIILKAFTSLVEEFPNLYCVIGGQACGQAEQIYYKELQETVDRAGIADLVRFPGFIRPEEFYPAIDIFCHQELDVEALGLVILEAMSVGKVVIADDKGGPKEILEGTTAGVLIRSGDPAALVSALRPVLRSPELRDALGIEAQRVLQQRFSLADWGKNWEQTLLELACIQYK